MRHCDLSKCQQLLCQQHKLHHRRLESSVPEFSIFSQYEWEWWCCISFGVVIAVKIHVVVLVDTHAPDCMVL
jgi:hypothetical protein